MRGDHLRSKSDRLMVIMPRFYCDNWVVIRSPIDHTRTCLTNPLHPPGIIVAVPGFWLIFTLLFFLILFLCRCCDVNSQSKPQKPEKLTCCKCCLMLFSTLTLCVISVGFVGNIYAHNGIVKVHSSSSELVKDVEQLRNFTMMINTELEQRMFANIKRLQDKLIHPLVRDREALERLHNILSECSLAV